MGQTNQNFTTTNIKEYFMHSSKIFKNSQIKKGYFDQDLAFLPKNLETIVYREDQISQLRDVFGDIVNGSKANARCYGPSGTGKTLTVKWLTHLAKELLEEKDLPNQLFVADINCALAKSSVNEIAYALIQSFPKEIVKSVAEELNFNFPIPSMGLTLGKYLEIFRQCFFKYNKQILIILDEFDKITGFKSRERSDDATRLIYSLTELAQRDLFSQKSWDTPPVNLILISNSNQRVDELIDSHARGRLGGPRVHFTTYSEEELVGVLETRRPAFEEGVLSDTIISEIAGHVANAEGHARVAIEVLGLAGTIATRKGKSKIIIDHVYEAMKLREEKLISEDILALNFDHTLAFLSIYALYYVCQEKEEDRELLPLYILYEVYKEIFNKIQVKKASENIILKGIRQFRRYLGDQLDAEQLCIIKGARPKCYGLSPDYQPETIREILLKDHSVIKKHPELREIVEFQIPEICSLLNEYQTKRLAPVK